MNSPIRCKTKFLSSLQHYDAEQLWRKMSPLQHLLSAHHAHSIYHKINFYAFEQCLKCSSRIQPYQLLWRTFYMYYIPIPYLVEFLYLSCIIHILKSTIWKAQNNLRHRQRQRALWHAVGRDGWIFKGRDRAWHGWHSTWCENDIKSLVL